MSIGIAIALKTRVILVRTGQAAGSKEEGAQPHLTVLRDNLAVSVLGTGAGADTAAETLLRRDAALDSGELVQARIAECIEGVRLAPHEGNDPAVLTDVQMIAAGIDSGGPYIAGAMGGTEMAEPESMLRRP